MKRPLAWLVCLALLALGAWFALRTADPERVAHSPAHTADEGEPQCELYVDGRVIDLEGAPVQGMSIRVSGDDENPDAVGTSDAGGRFRVGPFAAGAHDVLVNSRLKSLGCTTTLNVGVDPGEVELRVGSLVRIVGRVVVDETGAPCAAEVEAFGVYTRSDSRWRDDGRFEITDCLPGAYRFVARTRDARIAIERVSIAPGESPRDIELRVNRGVRLRVRDASSSNGDTWPSAVGVRLHGETVTWDGRPTWCSNDPKPNWFTIVAPAGALLVISGRAEITELAITPETCPSLAFDAVAGMEYDLEIPREDDLVLHLTGSRAFE